MNPAVEALAGALEKATGRRPETEYFCHPTRRWRIDLAYPEQKIAIESDGKHHLRASAHRRDCEKRNWLTEDGWRVLTYPAGALTTKCRLPLVVEQVVRCLIHQPDADSASVLTGKI